MARRRSCAGEDTGTGGGESLPGGTAGRRLKVTALAPGHGSRGTAPTTQTRLAEASQRAALTSRAAAFRAGSRPRHQAGLARGRDHPRWPNACVAELGLIFLTAARAKAS